MPVRLTAIADCPHVSPSNELHDHGIARIAPSVNTNPEVRPTPKGERMKKVLITGAGTALGTKPLCGLQKRDSM